ncbi:MAG: methyltransferase [Myxococcota bacterium]
MHSEDSLHVQTGETWERLLAEFLQYHRSGLNVALHLITTPLGLFGLFAIAGSVSPFLPPVLAGAYLAVLFSSVPRATWLITAGVLIAIVTASIAWPLGALWGGVMVVVGYFAQWAAHYAVNEPTMEGAYANRPGWLRRFIEHSVYLPPLVFHAASIPERSPLWWLVAQNRIYLSRVEGPKPEADMTLIRNWVHAQNPPETHTTHWWWTDLPEDARAAYVRLANSSAIFETFRREYGDDYEVDVVWGMNEIYVAGPDQQLTSDTVFYDPHLDGPFAVFPFCTVFRCMLSVSPDERVKTHFPMTGPDYDSGGDAYAITTGDALAFDFNRELHYISSAVQRPKMRITLKLHYLVRPKAMGAVGKLAGTWTTMYNKRARQVFLDTLTPGSFSAKLQAAWVLATTHTFEFIARFLGPTNLAYAGLLAIISLISGNALPFVAGISFVHYLIYIGTYNQRTKIAYGQFLRDAIFFKSLSMGALAVLYVTAFQLSLLSALSVLMVVGGFGLAMLSTRALGVVRTYFGVEMGLVAPRRINQFPYDTIPHPMIVGAIVGLIGVHLVIGFGNWWWLVPAHILFYAIHLTQEILGGYPETNE